MAENTRVLAIASAESVLDFATNGWHLKASDAALLVSTGSQTRTMLYLVSNTSGDEIWTDVLPPGEICRYCVRPKGKRPSDYPKQEFLAPAVETISVQATRGGRDE